MKIGFKIERIIRNLKKIKLDQIGKSFIDGWNGSNVWEMFLKQFSLFGGILDKVFRVEIKLGNFYSKYLHLYGMIFSSSDFAPYSG